MEDYISIVMDNVNFREGHSGLRNILTILYVEGRMPTKVLARKVFLPVPVVVAIKKEFIKLKLMEQNGGIQLSAEGKLYVERELGYAGLKLDIFNQLRTNAKAREEMIIKLSDKYADIYNQRPQVDVTIDQAKATVETSFKRAMLCLEKQTLVGKRILCIGDDDLVSIASGLLLKEIYDKTNSDDKKIVVFDIDERFAEYINKIAKEYELPVECFIVNLREPLPISYANSFDCFFTDPPYTLEGMTLFLSRGVGALKKEKGLQVFLSYGQKPINETLAMQEVILGHGLVIQEVHKGFNIYEGASLLGNVSQMIVLESTDDLKTIIQMDESYIEKLYTAENREREVAYECKSCNTIFKIGRNEKFNTIEQLKDKGCNYCGGQVFEQIRKTFEERKGKKKKKSLGEHILADFFDCSSEVLGNVDLIKEYMHEAANKANAAIVTEEFHNFEPWGVSGAIIIKESHLTIHSWPEYRYAAVDIFTCGDSLDLWAALEYIKSKLECGHMEYNDVARGLLIRIAGNTHDLSHRVNQ